jgi:hypothetical protein
MVTIEYANNNKTLKYFDMAALLTLENNGKFYWYKVQKCTVLQYSKSSGSQSVLHGPQGICDQFAGIQFIIATLKFIFYINL